MERTSNKLLILLICVMLALSTFIAFEQVRQNDFIEYDDVTYVTKNSHVNGGLTRESFFWAFTTSHASNWHPLTWLSHMLDCELFGLNPFWHHLSNLFFHIVNTLLLFWVLKSMTGAVWRSAFVAAAFALHPLHVESVAWLSERKDVLSSFFWMLTMFAYLRYAKRPGAGRYLIILLTFALGLMAKPMLVTLPFVLLLLDYWPLGRFQKGKAYRLVLEKIPLFALSAASSVVTFVVQKIGGAVVAAEHLPLNMRVTNALVSYINYIGKLIYPNRLVILYPHPIEGLPFWQPMVCFMILVVVSAVIVYVARNRRYLAVGWFWYLGTLVPVIGFVQVGLQAMADRYTYLPSIGIFIMIAWGAAELFARWRYRGIVLGVLAGIVLAILLVCTRIQVRYWKNSLTLFGHAVEETENNYAMHSYYGGALLEKGRVEEAEMHIKKTLRIYPRDARATNYMGRVFLMKRKVDEAIRCFKKVLQARTDWPTVYSNLGLAYAWQDKYDMAIKNYNEALRLQPDYTDAINNLGVALREQGKINEAIKKWKKVLKLEPDYPNAHFNMGRAMAKQGKTDEAIKHLNRALCLKLEPSDVHNSLAKVYFQQGKIEQAVGHWAEALKIKPGWLEVLNNLAWCKAAYERESFHDPSEAIQLAEKACELTDRKEPGLLDTLSVAYAAAGRFDEAIETAEKAIDLALSSGQKELAEEIKKHLELYKAGQPYSELASKSIGE